jgi:hypothetical protein
VRGRHPVEATDHLEVLAPGELAVDGGELAGQPNPPAHREGLANDVVAEHAGIAGRWLEQGGQDANERGLARPVGAEQPEDHPGRDVEGQAVERDHVTELLA